MPNSSPLSKSRETDNLAVYGNDSDIYVAECLKRILCLPELRCMYRGAKT